MKNYMEYVDNAKDRIEQLKDLRSLGLICADGDFVPSVHYPPITQYPQMSEQDLYGTYTMPKDGLMDIYVHFPFCERHCVFCHYPGKLGLQTEEKTRYIGYLKREFEIYLSRFGIGKLSPRSVLIGGGTPTYLEPAALEDFLAFFNDKADMSHCRQFNYDVDPNTLLGDKGMERLRIMRDMGVTRLTIGIQSLDDSVLKVMNRPHDAKMAVESIYNAKSFGFGVNIEFIYGHPGEDYGNWAEVMEKAVQLPADEIQLYRLKVRAYGDMQGDIIRRRAETPSFEATMTMKSMAIQILNENGFHENLRRVYTKDKKNISHYAYNQCCNLFDQAGFGITAFSSYRDRFALNTQYFTEYYKALDEGRLPMDRGYIRDAEQQMRWSIVLPLKNMDVKKAAFKKMNGILFGDVFQTKVKRLKKYGLLEETDRIVRLTELGGFVADEVAEQFNSNEFIPFPKEDYADGPLNPYRDNTTDDAFGYARAYGPLETAAFTGSSEAAAAGSLAAPVAVAMVCCVDLCEMRDAETQVFTEAEIKEMLTSEGGAREALFARARKAREESLGDVIKLRGVIEISNVCAKNCDYCAMRASNASLERYTLDTETILRAARDITANGISTVFLQSGQSAKNNEALYKAISVIRKESGCEILLCAGEKPKPVYEAYKAAGADSYILKFESSDPALYERATHSNWQKRITCARYIREAGMALGTGSIIGLPGQTLDDIAGDILFAASMKPDFVSVSPFIPNKGTPYEHLPAGDINLTLNAIAVLRLAMPHALIPTVSALEYIHPDGQAAGLLAGANVITVNFTPKSSRDKYAIYASDRFVVGLEHARKTAEKAGMRIAPRNEVLV